jgi:hypothetical protein
MINSRANSLFSSIFISVFINPCCSCNTVQGGMSCAQPKAKAMATIRPEVSGITGLDNYNLSGQATFDKETGVLINSFLARYLNHFVWWLTMETYIISHY